MAAPDRFSVLASLPWHGGFRRVLALDRAGAPRAVVLAFAPTSVTDDPARLAAVLRDAEAAARLHHAGAAAVLGTETVDGELAVVEMHRAGAPLRALLDAAGRLPPDVAVRIVLDACAAVSRAHGVDAGDGLRLTHGAIDALRVVVGEEGPAFLCGFGLAGGGDPGSDVRALGAVLYECLAGAPPDDPPRPLQAPGVPLHLAAAVDRATGAAGERFGAAAALAGAIAEAMRPASHAAVAAYADAILPQEGGELARIRRTLEAALRGEGRGAGPREVVADAASTFPKPEPPPSSSRLPLTVGALCLAVGFALGFSLSRARSASTGAAATRAADTSPATGVPIAAPEAPPTSDAQPAAKPARAERSRRSAPPRMGTLDVSAPDDADVFLDGKRIGRGSVQVAVREGRHRVEVRRRGATVAERFTVRPGETWTYTAASTP